MKNGFAYINMNTYESEMRVQDLYMDLYGVYMRLYDVIYVYMILLDF